MKSKRTIKGRRYRLATFEYAEDGTKVAMWIPIEWYSRRYTRSIR